MHVEFCGIFYCNHFIIIIIIFLFLVVFCLIAAISLGGRYVAFATFLHDIFVFFCLFIHFFLFGKKTRESL